MTAITKPMNVPHLRKLGLFTIVLTSLWVVFFSTSANQNFTGKDGDIIFMSVLGGLMFVFFLMFSRETKQWKKTQKSLGN
jgi:hypothetical protein